jgi:hypothetical protein
MDGAMDFLIILYGKCTQHILAKGTKQIDGYLEGVYGEGGIYQ